MHRLPFQKRQYKQDTSPAGFAPDVEPDLARRRTVLASSATALTWVVAGTASMAGTGNLSGCTRQSARVQVPDVNFTLLDGTPSRLSAWHGQVLLVNFWATSCALCVQEMPLLASTHNRYADRGFHTLAVAMQYDPPAAVAMFAQSRALPFGVVIDNLGAVARSFGDVRGTPTSFALDKRGAIAKRWVGAPAAAELHATLEQLLAEAT